MPANPAGASRLQSNALVGRVAEALGRSAPLSASCNPSQNPYDDDVPTILRERGFRFFFYMADRFEPPHVHVERDDCAAKLWLDPLEFAFIEGFRRHEANDILHITEQHRDEFLRAWYKTFGDLSHE